MGDAARTIERTLRNDPVIEEARERAPSTMRAEIVRGALLMAPAPRLGHLRAQGALLSILLGAKKTRFTRNPPAGWFFALTPELHLGAAPDKLNPDIAGWRAARAPALSDDPHRHDARLGV